MDLEETVPLSPSPTAEETAAPGGPAPDLPRAGRLLGVDVGQRRIGLAISDETQWLATPLQVVQRSARAEDFRRLAHIAAERRVVGLVIGHPLNADGSEGPQGRTVARYARHLAETLGLPWVLWDEHGSTQAALERLAHAGRRRRQMPVDAEAAAVILQDYLDSRRAGPPAAPEDPV
ncbi:MAG: Holliday junction resolvase RuvX [Caldilineales bacterium]|nr:Holliday junction resolvase RuvX [Caldilineales bacterium]MDW8318651.1 Holliday junction resolvase RuvX [Anaerolineae bacterium]